MAARRYFIPKAVTLPYRLQLRHPLTLRLARAASAATAPLARARGGVAGGLARRPAHLPRLAGAVGVALLGCWWPRPMPLPSICFGSAMEEPRYFTNS